MVSGAIMPTADPFLYTLSFTTMKGMALDTVEAAAVEALERVRMAGIEPEELARAKRQLRARLVFETDSVTNIAHQIGYFATVAGPDYLGEMQSRIDAVTPEQVWGVAKRRLGSSTRTVGWFRPLEPR
jgi:predicted Zn-dependent peptidase